jgi:putative transcriptional regulator
MAIVRYTPDPANPPIMSAATTARLEAMTDEEITAAAESAPDTPPLTDQEITRIPAIRIARTARMRTGLTPAPFAGAFAVNLSRLRILSRAAKRLIACSYPSSPWRPTPQTGRTECWRRVFEWGGRAMTMSRRVEVI